MLKMRKILSVALVVVMALSMMVMSSSALTDGKTFGFVVKADKTEKEIVPGAKVTVTIALDMSDYNQLMSDMRLAILFDNTVYTPDLTTRTFHGDWAEYAKEKTKPTVNPTFASLTMANSTMTEEEKALYNSCVLQVVNGDTSKGHSAKTGYKVTEEADGVSVVQFSIVFNVTGDAAALAAGNKNILISDASGSKSQYIKQTTGSTVATYVPQASIDTTRANIMANMPSAPSYAVAKYKTQVKFTGDKTTAPDDLFQFRLTSVITAADFAAMNSNGNTIKSVGFIAANTGAADADAAKTAVEKGTALPSAWKAASTDYVSQANASSDAYFGAIVKNISHASQATDIDCIAYVCYNDGTADHYVWYSAAVTAKVASGYDAAVAAWKAQ